MTLNDNGFLFDPRGPGRFESAQLHVHQKPGLGILPEGSERISYGKRFAYQRHRSRLKTLPNEVSASLGLERPFSAN